MPVWICFHGNLEELCHQKVRGDEDWQNSGLQNFGKVNLVLKYLSGFVHGRHPSYISTIVGGWRLTKNARLRDSTDIREWTKHVSEYPPSHLTLCVWGGSWCIINKKFAVIYWLIPVMKHDCRWPSHNMFYLMLLLLLSSEAYVLILLLAAVFKQQFIIVLCIWLNWWAKFEWYEVSIDYQRLDGTFI